MAAHRLSDRRRSGQRLPRDSPDHSGTRGRRRCGQVRQAQGAPRHPELEPRDLHCDGGPPARRLDRAMARLPHRLSAGRRHGDEPAGAHVVHPSADRGTAAGERAVAELYRHQRHPPDGAGGDRLPDRRVGRKRRPRIRGRVGVLRSDSGHHGDDPERRKAGGRGADIHQARPDRGVPVHAGGQPDGARADRPGNGRSPSPSATSCFCPSLSPRSWRWGPRRSG